MVRASYTISCPVCQLTDYGSNITMYTSSADTTIQSGIYVYEDVDLTIPQTVNYFKYDNTIYEVSNEGLINQYCTENGNC